MVIFQAWGCNQFFVYTLCIKSVYIALGLPRLVGLVIWGGIGR